ncbi:Calcineurin-like phosphoesterase [Polaromonas sp. OV174]|uniref:metallophosphoesterase n=1 Tax=Polaromonas sp. OV174 TaxID=1855300 RepID=UPI0008E256D8|nr:metallophosphoesterase [Polaromonas sp. OV174]SFB72744.1 Calcineurin-like phosphoesterase [Polaromonas sp. OV174]
MSNRILAGALLALSLSCAQAQSFSFGLWGDMPYQKAGDDPKIPALLKSINRSDIAFSIYDGDIKDGSSKCTDDIYASALTMFGQMKKPVVYVPGDNEWTDCHRLNNGGYDGLERLTYLRKTMFPTTSSLGQRQMPLIHQGQPGEKFVENTRFSHRGIVFATLNLPGSNNNKILNDKDCSHKSARSAEQCEASNAEYLERDAANVRWMQQAFQAAKAQKAPGLVLVFQADPGFDLPETEDLDESQAPGVSGYRNFISSVVAETEQFPGQVLLVHGDTHFFKLDKPLYSPTKLLANLTRLQTFGSPMIHWVRITVNTKTANVFTVHPVIVKQ